MTRSQRSLFVKMSTAVYLYSDAPFSQNLLQFYKLLNKIKTVWLFWRATCLYQDAFFTPGICPLYASSLKHIRHIPNFRKYACGLPQILQRLYSRVEYFCFRCCFNFIANFAKLFPPFLTISLNLSQITKWSTAANQASS